ncbi:MAG: tRNA (uridine(54)-C5)-methyltransferase TrmA, partial [Campylobacterales bacterium]
MTCEHLGKCGSCRIYDKSYQHQLEEKHSYLKNLLGCEVEVFSSKEVGFRNRAEFRILHTENGLKRGMFDFNKKLMPIQECHIIAQALESASEQLLEEISKNQTLSYKLYGLDLFTNSKDEVVATLIYHKPLDKKWESEAELLQEKTSINIIGRSRKQKLVLKKETLLEEFEAKKPYSLLLREGAFFQPNFYMNKKMLEFARSTTPKGDLLELYCGNGNFSFALSDKYKNIFATEISKASIKDAETTKNDADIKNIEFGRLSADELIEALNKKREFKRLEHVNMEDYNFQTLLVDPPRSGLSQSVVEFSNNFSQIIYISCNPKTLKRDLDMLEGFRIKKAALFDQFPWTEHIESGVILE